VRLGANPRGGFPASGLITSADDYICASMCESQGGGKTKPAACARYHDQPARLRRDISRARSPERHLFLNVDGTFLFDLLFLSFVFLHFNGRNRTEKQTKFAV
jgi:hypothetical protein